MITTKIFLLFVVALLANSCSTAEFFMIVNNSDKSLFVNYTLLEKEDGFGIFNDNPRVYANSDNALVEWNKPVNAVAHKKDSSSSIEVILPPHCTLVFGTLFNDVYTTCDQEFNNGRYFNLTSLNLSQKEKKVDIDSTNFDFYFTKKSGKIYYSFK